VTDLPVSLDQLVQMVEERTPRGDALGRIGAAVAMAADLDALGDNVVGQFVDAARAAGLPWSQIGSVLGVTKQAAQQRFVARPDEPALMKRYTERTRNAIELASEAAKRLHHSYVGTEHILMGILELPSCIGTKVVMSLGPAPRQVHDALDHAVPGPSPASGGPMPFTPRAKKVLELSLREALRLGHNYVGTEHVVIALAAAEGIAGDVLRDLGLTEERLRGGVVTYLSGYIRLPRDP
jgi:hypothetical protein